MPDDLITDISDDALRQQRMLDYLLHEDIARKERFVRSCADTCVERLSVGDYTTYFPTLSPMSVLTNLNDPVRYDTIRVVLSSRLRYYPDEARLIAEMCVRDQLARLEGDR